MNLKKYGEVKVEQAFKNKPTWETFLVQIDGQWIRNGLNIQSESVTTDLLTH
ncbi:hypothetical protein ACGRL8_02125 [Vibrio rumoiensis]|uniref:Uncharacterized protein n=1 Tax=Vibrio rumoiensis TaxID=76258 RepID=A0ABW7IUV0_9VIBR|nr:MULTISPECIES: hypothetical protein [Vibrio]